MKLSEAECAAFDREGYLFRPGMFSPDEAALLKDAAHHIFALDREEVWREKTGAARTAFAAHTYDEAHGRLGRHPRLIEPVKEGERLGVLGVKAGVVPPARQRLLEPLRSLRILALLVCDQTEEEQRPGVARRALEDAQVDGLRLREQALLEVELGLLELLLDELRRAGREARRLRSQTALR